MRVNDRLALVGAPEKSVVEQSADSEAGGLCAVFLRDRALLSRLLVARTGNRDDAEDLLQDMWLKLVQLSGQPGTQPIGQPSGYLYRMAINLASDRRIATARAQVRDAAWIDAQPGAEMVPGADRILIGRDALARVDQALAAMPDRMRLALRLFRVEELSQRQIADRLGISISGVEKLLKRGYRQLQELFDPAVADLGEPRRLVGKEPVRRDD